MKKILTALAFIFFLSFVSAASDSSAGLFSGYPYKSATWKSKTTVKSEKESVTFEQIILLKNKKMRADGKFYNRATNETENQVTIISDNTMYYINPGRKQGMKYSLDSKALPEDSPAASGKCREKAEKSGAEKINGIKCDKYEYTCGTGGGEIKITEFRNDRGFSVKTVSKTGGTVTTVEISELKINASVPDSKFIPPADIKFMDMDAILGKNMKEMMKVSGQKVKGKAGGKDSEEDAGQKMMKDMMKGMLGD